MTYSCCDELRRQAVRDHPTLNGIDFLEVIDRAAPTEAERQRTLEVHFVKPLVTPTPTSPTFGSTAANASPRSVCWESAPEAERRPMS